MDCLLLLQPPRARSGTNAQGQKAKVDEASDTHENTGQRLMSKCFFAIHAFLHVA